MIGNKKGLVPNRSRNEAPTQAITEVIDSYCTTPVIGGSATGPATGWEAITPKRSSKPGYLIKAQAAVQSAWADYLWHIDAGADQGTLEALWDAYDQAKRQCDEAWAAAEQGVNALPIPF